MSDKKFSSTKSTSDLHETIDLNLLCMNLFEFRESVLKRVSYQRMQWQFRAEIPKATL